MSTPVSPLGAVRKLGRIAVRMGLDALAAHLAARGVSGRALDPCRCVLAHALGETCPDYLFYVPVGGAIYYRERAAGPAAFPDDGESARAGGWGVVGVAPALDQFARQFDAGAYPHLQAAA